MHRRNHDVVSLVVRNMFLRAIEEGEHARIAEARGAHVAPTATTALHAGKKRATAYDLPIRGFIESQRDGRRMKQRLADLPYKDLRRQTNFLAVLSPSYAHGGRKGSDQFVEYAAPFPKRNHL